MVTDDQQTIAQPNEALTEQSEINQPENLSEKSQHQETQPSETEEPEISVDAEGEVKFRDDFFGDVENIKQPEKTEVTEQTQNYYTDEELQNTPYDQWADERMPEDVKRYKKFYQAQMAKQQQNAQTMQQRPAQPLFMQEPHQYTTKELTDEAKSIAAQNLGLDDVDDFDSYDDEHRAALDLARQELLQKRQSEISDYQRRTTELKSLNDFYYALSSRPDYAEFDGWLSQQLKEANMTPVQLNERFRDFAQKSGERYSEIQNLVSSWYGTFQNWKKQQHVSPHSRAARPPVLESTRSGNAEGRKSFNLKDFGALDADEQAKALMDMGIV